MYPFCGQVAFRGWSWLTTRSAGSILTARIVAPRASRTTAAIPKFIVRSVDKGCSNMKMHKNNRRTYYTQISHRTYITTSGPHAEHQGLWGNYLSWAKCRRREVAVQRGDSLSQMTQFPQRHPLGYRSPVSSSSLT